MNTKDKFHSLQDVRILHDNLGKGYSSKVSLVEHRQSRRKYALKSVILTRLILESSKKESRNTSNRKYPSNLHCVTRTLWDSTRRSTRGPLSIWFWSMPPMDLYLSTCTNTGNFQTSKSPLFLKNFATRSVTSTLLEFSTEISSSRIFFLIKTITWNWQILDLLVWWLLQKRGPPCVEQESISRLRFTQTKSRDSNWTFGVWELFCTNCAIIAPLLVSRKKISNRQIRSCSRWNTGWLIRCDLNINPLFRDAIDNCLQYHEETRIGIDQLLQHKMFKICQNVSSEVLRMKTLSKSQPRKSLPLYNKSRHHGYRKMKRPVKNLILNPYVSAFSKPLKNTYFISKPSKIFFR